MKTFGRGISISWFIRRIRFWFNRNFKRDQSI